MILDKQTADKKLRRMAMEVAERNYGNDEIILIGIKENGIYIAHKIEQYLKDVFGGVIQVLSLEIDKKNPGEIKLSKVVELKTKTILLVDDVANTGRTMLYALKPLLSQYPKSIQTLALVERTHKQFPIEVNYTGLSISTTIQENIIVEVNKGEILGASFGK